MRKSIDWVVAGGKAGEVGYCTRCGQGLSLNLPQNISVVAAASDAFVKVHSKCAPGKYIEKPATTPDEWFAGRDTGLSSKTIFGVMMGRPIAWASAPSDPSDFGRCYRLLKLFPAWRERLTEVSDRFPEWLGLVSNWDELASLYEEEFPTGSAPSLYARMRELTGRNPVEVW